MSYTPRLEIDMQIVDANIKMLSNDKKPCLMVKANQYHVLANIKPLVALGYDFFGVSTLQEALAILKEFDVDVMIFTPISVSDMQKYNHPRLHFSVCDLNTLMQLNNDYHIHLNFDTGMGRIGFNPDEVSNIIDYLQNHHLKITGIYSHFPCASDQLKTIAQIKLFKMIYDEFVYQQIPLTYIHLQNSLGACLYDLSWCNMVRLGIGIWGYASNYKESLLQIVKPALKLVAPVSFIKNYHGYLSYDHIDYVEGIIATIKLGYNDGLIRSLRGYDFKPGKIVGNICMCQCMLLVDDINTKEIVIFDKASLYDLCAYANITTYEFLCGLSYRIKRVIKE